MGYASVIPFQILNYTMVFPNNAVASTIASTQTLGTFTTPSWNHTPSSAYLDLIIQTGYNTNAGQNNLRNTSIADHALSPDAITYQSCGLWEDAIFNTAASGWRYGQYRIAGTTNLKSYLQPDVLYYCDVRNIKSTGNNLELYDIYGELKMVFGV